MIGKTMIGSALIVLSAAAVAGGSYTPSTPTPRFTILGPNTIAFYEGQRVSALVKTDSACMPRASSKITVIGTTLTKREGRLQVDKRVCEVIHVDTFEVKQ